MSIYNLQQMHNIIITQECIEEKENKYRNENPYTVLTKVVHNEAIMNRAQCLEGIVTAEDYTDRTFR